MRFLWGNKSGKALRNGSVAGFCQWRKPFRRLVFFSMLNYFIEQLIDLVCAIKDAVLSVKMEMYDTRHYTTVRRGRPEDLVELTTRSYPGRPSRSSPTSVGQFAPRSRRGNGEERTLLLQTSTGPISRNEEIGAKWPTEFLLRHRNRTHRLFRPLLRSLSGCLLHRLCFLSLAV